MLADKNKLEIAMARACIDSKKQLAEKAGVNYQQIKRSWERQGTQPGIIGRIAKALNVDVTDIIVDN